MRLLLCSAGLGAIGPWLDDDRRQPRTVAFVDVAAQPLTTAPFLAECWRALEQCGCDVRRLDLRTEDKDRVDSGLRDADVVFVAGGYPVYLLEWAQRSGFLDSVRAAVRTGRVDYVGVSAGAALAGPSMEPLAAPDDPGDVDDYAALDLVDFVVVPHVNRYPADVFEARRKHWAGRLTLRPLSDDRAISVVDTAGVELQST